MPGVEEEIGTVVIWMLGVALRIVEALATVTDWARETWAWLLGEEEDPDGI